MQYQKITYEDLIIEFHNNWLGEETVIVNGQLVSKKSSIWGADHPFTVMEKGHPSKYILTTKVNAAMQVLLDLRKNGVIISENIVVSFGTKPRSQLNKEKKEGIRKLQQYDLDEAEILLKEALNFDANDPEIYFHLACVYSVQEKTAAGFEALRKAVEKKLQDVEVILNHDLLAYLRMHPAFEGFVDSNFSTYDKNLILEMSDEEE